MVPESINIFEYEQLLMGQRLNFQLSFKGGESDNKKEVGNVWRYAITELLGWTPEEALKNLNNEIVDRLLLNKTFCGLNFDREHSYISDYRFILQYAFPEKIRYDSYVETIAEYEKFAKLGKWAHDPSNAKQPKRFFSDGDGNQRASWCLRYVTDLYMGDMTIEEKYKFFADEEKAMEWLKGKALYRAMDYLYGTPLPYFHAASLEKDPFLYNAYLVKNIFDKENDI